MFNVVISPVCFSFLKFQKDNSMFKNYTYEGCIFECRLRNAFDAVGCIPWDYPIPPSIEEHDQIRICNSSREENENISESDLAKFSAYMNSEKSITNCSCYSDCEEQSFKIQVIYTEKWCKIVISFI